MDPEYINRELSHYDEEERDARSVYPTGFEREPAPGHLWRGVHDRRRAGDQLRH